MWHIERLNHKSPRGCLDYMLKHFFLKVLHVLLLLVGKNISTLFTKHFSKLWKKIFIWVFQSFFQHFGAVSPHIANGLLRLLSSLSNLYDWED